HRRPRAVREGHGPQGHGDQRRRRGRAGRDEVRRRGGPEGDGADADPGHRDRQRAVHRRHPGAEHRVRSPRDPRPGGGKARLGGGEGGRGGGREGTGAGGGKWGGRVDEYLEHMEQLLSPKLIIIGGGVSRKSEKFMPYLTGLRATVVPAAMLNDAGIVGAAMT